MQIESSTVSDTKVKLSIKASQNEIDEVKKTVVAKLAGQVKIDGFRQGNVPAALAEKHIDPNKLQGEFIEEIVNRLYVAAVSQEKLRVVANPQVEIKKFVPFSTFEFIAEVEVVGKISLPNYKALKLQKHPVKVTAKDVNEVLDRMQTQVAEYKSITEAAKEGHRVLIDFSGKDSKGELVKGATGKDYPLLLGSKTFIPGFEENLIGLKPTEKKTFTITFPKDYSLKALQSKKVTFNVTVNKVEEVIKSDLDDKFAAKMGPFKTLKELKTDIEKHLKIEKEQQSERDFEESIIKAIVAKTKVALPQILIDEQIETLDKEFQQNLAYRGESIGDYLESKSLTKDQYQETELKPAAQERLKAGLVLSEIATKEKIEVTPEEVEIRKQVLKGQYSDSQMQEQLNKPEATRDIVSRLLTEKTINKLKSYILKT